VGKITFGTSGWRAIMADDFTFANVRIAVGAIAKTLQKNGQADRGLVIAGDYRFFSEEFMALTARVLSGYGVPTYLTPVGTPTPVVSYELLRRGCAGSINFTASHNPYEYQGLKFNGADGGPAPVSVTMALEAEVEALIASGETIPEMALETAREKGMARDIDPKPEYFKRIREMVRFDLLRKAHMKIVYDAMNGCGIGYMDSLLIEAGVQTKLLHMNRDPFFGGHHPEPSVGELTEAMGLVKSWPAHLGLANDGDADRFGIVDSDGTYLTPNEVLAILLNHLLNTRDWKGVVVRSVATTHLLDSIAKAKGVEVRETPVGFKYIAEVMAKEPILLGGEESGGLTVHGHVPEKDGILACLLMAEAAAMSGRNLKSVLSQIHKDFGSYYGDRLNLKLKPGLKETMLERLKNDPPTAVAGKKVESVVTLDGYKFILTGGDWLMVRFSGTEPLMRCYMESRTPEGLEALREAGRHLTAG
jgi:alpha-D-glucose phosphate-specific phosphoglucomutase